MINLFIDANIYLRFYAYAEDTFTELEKLTALVQTGKIRILLPQQVKDEVSRNREAEIARALVRFEQSSFKVEIPYFSRHFEESVDLLQKLKIASDAKSALSNRINKEIDTDKLRADDVIRKLGEVAETMPISDEIVERAKLRNALGNPPGKRDSLGDQIVWESILKSLADEQDIHIISNDGDYYSKLKTSEPHASLTAEMHSTGKGSIFCYKSLSSFTNKHFPEIKLPIDAIKSDAIHKLINSTNFDQTHQQISKIEEIFDELSFEDAIIIFQGIIENSQISWIAKDQDVKSFYKKLHDKFYEQTSVELDEQLHNIADYFDSVPF